MKDEKAYVLYATQSYSETAQGCVNSLRAVSNLSIYVYMMNSDVKIDGATTIRWNCDVANLPQKDYIDRLDGDIYRILIQRPLIVLDALNRAKIVTYVDSDSVATEYVDTIFDYFNPRSIYPAFTEGIYNYMFINGEGGTTFETCLEYPACFLFGVTARNHYRQTGYFVAGQSTTLFLKEWSWMCNHPTILQDNSHYAPFNEETILNVLLWKYNVAIGLPLIYINGTPKDIEKYGYTGTFVKDWLKIPSDKKEILFYHGEKNLEKMNSMIKKSKPIKVMFLEFHLSTGGAPKFCQTRIEALQKYTDVEISVVEYQCQSMDFVVQRDKIRGLVGENFNTLYEDKILLFDLIAEFQPDIIHIDEMSERMDDEMVTRLYSSDRKYKIVETCHDISFNPKEKRFIPDAFLFCTRYHTTTFKDVPTDAYIVEFPIDDNHSTKWEKHSARTKLNMDHNKIQVLNVGLWAPWKNQAEGLEIARRYPDMVFNFIGNQAGNFKEYWEPLMDDIPDNVIVWEERNDVDIFMKACDIFMFNSTWECAPIVLKEAIGYGLPIIARNLPQYGDMFTKYIHPIDTNLEDLHPDYAIPTDNTTGDFGKKHLDIYTKIMNKPIMNVVIPSKVTISQHFVENPFLEIKGESNSDFLIKFFDENGICHYENTIKSNHWVKLNRSYYTKWTTKVWENGELIYENTLDYTDKRVYIALDSEALGDQISWMPFIFEFQKKHKCHVIVSTFKNSLFDYPELAFVTPGTVVNNIYGMYKIGWFYDSNREPKIPNTIPLQKAACNILGLEYKELKPRINFVLKKRQFDYKYVTIVTNSSMGCKFLPKETWQEIIDYLISKGYKVINVSKERNSFNNCEQIEDISIENTMHIIYHSEFTITISSGLGWLAWALGKQTVLVANFTEEGHEWLENCIRITNTNVCHACWNNPNFRFSASDWNWCPINKNTPNQFICHKSISSNMVIQRINESLIQIPQ